MTQPEINLELTRLSVLNGHYSETEKKYIKYAFVGVEDEIITKGIYRQLRAGNIQPYPQKNPVFWIGFTDHTIARIEYVLQDPLLNEILSKNGFLDIDITFGEDWTDYIKIYKGYRIMLSYDFQPLEYEISDFGTDIKYPRIIPEKWNNSIQIRYSNSGMPIETFANPVIRFRSKGFHTVNASLRYEPQ